MYVQDAYHCHTKEQWSCKCCSVDFNIWDCFAFKLPLWFQLLLDLMKILLEEIGMCSDIIVFAIFCNPLFGEMRFFLKRVGIHYQIHSAAKQHSYKFSNDSLHTIGQTLHTRSVLVCTGTLYPG